MKPVLIFIDGQELSGYTEMSLKRSKDQLTGELSVSIFMGYIPQTPIMMHATRGREILVYVGGQLVFTGIIDRRKGSGAKHGGAGTSRNERPNSAYSSETALTVGANEYTVKLTARGKTKYLIDSSHQHPTTNMLKPTTKDAFEALVEPWGVQIDWQGSEIKLDKIRFRDGARVVDELHRLALEHAYFVYETRDGKLRITDIPPTDVGEELVLGRNILSFSADQAEDMVKSKIKIKGQRTEVEVWGEDAVVPTVVELQDGWVEAEIPVTVQHYGNGTPEALERRGRYEMNKRSTQAKRVTLDVFHVQSTDGRPWDIGRTHYVEIPPEGVFDVMECVELSYVVQNDKTLTTKITLAPPPAASVSGGGSGATSNLPEITGDLQGVGASRRAEFGVTFATGQYPSPWTGPVISVLQYTPLSIITSIGGALFSGLENASTGPALSLPPDYQSENDE